jgi:uncharacterized protein (TIGR00730 family)
MIKNICVFCSSSDVLAEVYNLEAEQLAGLFLVESYNLIYGGARVGLMGLLAKKILKGNGHVTGVVPELIYNKNIADSSVSQLIVTKDMRSRKAKMDELADAFIALPGEFGTLEELIEVITLKQLEYHQKPIVIINTDGFYNKLLDFFEVFYNHDFAKNDYKSLYYIANDSDEAVNYLKNYKPGNIVSKWYKANLNL